ncbi:hypothetical protein ACGF5C_31970 [Micromonospora sp. NPDC047620]|uniref:hypothetical protein n=1 Tax=Micromonospora sp. NPDC047620 TaxID=3364251 RepID=UPI00371F55FC
MAGQAQPATGASPSPWSAVARAVALLTVAVSVLMTALAWPSVRSSVHGVPIAVAGPAPAVRQISAALDERLPDAFEITEVADTAAAQLIRDRDVYGARAEAPRSVTSRLVGPPCRPCSEHGLPA